MAATPVSGKRKGAREPGASPTSVCVADLGAAVIDGLPSCGEGEWRAPPPPPLGSCGRETSKRKSTATLLVMLLNVVTCALLVSMLVFGLLHLDSSGHDGVHSHNATTNSIDAKNENGTSDRNPSDFVKQFSNSVYSQNKVIPFILQKGRLLCRKTQKEEIPEGAAARAKLFVDMIRNALEFENTRKEHILTSQLPILLLNGDSTGCDIVKQVDTMKFPRLSWCIPSHKYGNGWCNARGMTSFQAWRTFHEDHQTHASWKLTFASHSNRYPWTTKLNKAVWRGSPTADNPYLSRARVDKIAIPRERLVRASIENPQLIDAAFTKAKGFPRLVHENETRLVERMEFRDQMDYKAILDIDGNAWSSRFPLLLCTNSVIIKIDPDYTEPFYRDLSPMVHYVPASLDNLTQVVSMVLHEDNDKKMQAIADSANSWCRREMTRSGFAKDTLLRLEEYGQAVNDHVLNGSINMSDITEDFVECYGEETQATRGKGW